jgi:peptidoglycan pentaglycine glycine transferase (the first glycine)
MDRKTWDTLFKIFPNPHILQSWEWANTKANFGWTKTPLVWRGNAGIPESIGMLLERKIMHTNFLPSFGVFYMPRGPILDWKNIATVRHVLADLEMKVRKKGVIFLKIDPEVIIAEGIPGSTEEQKHAEGTAIKNELKSRGWIFSNSQIQYKNTMWLDLNGSQEDWLNRMKPKTRYNLRLAEKKGVVIQPGSKKDLHLLFQMYAETSIRDSFTIRNEEYYRFVWDTFITKGMAIPLIAKYKNTALAGLILFILGSRAWYLFGMSSGKSREFMPNYLLQWEAMKRASKEGCTVYDLWGAPDNFNESDPMWGVYRFKEGLGARVIQTIGAWDYFLRPALYTLYSKIIPGLLDIMRKRGKQRTLNMLG